MTLVSSGRSLIGAIESRVSTRGSTEFVGRLLSYV